MPTLQNPRHEIFAQELANGTSVNKAYEKAGYHRHYGNSSTLNKRAEVQNRVSELLKEREAAITTRYAAEVEYTRETLLADLEEARQRAIDLKNPSAEISATMGKAKILGLIIDRREVGEAGAFDGMTDEELVANAVRLARELGIAGPQLVEDDNKKSL